METRYACRPSSNHDLIDCASDQHRTLWTATDEAINRYAAAIREAGDLEEEDEDVCN